ncbi:hypothetical protein N9241_01345 [bacterium]|nr:hypothetical protein [bacterium]
MSSLKAQKNAIFFLIAFVVFIASLLTKGLPAGYSKIMSVTKDTKRFAAGEIVSGFYMEQAIEWALVEDYEKVGSSPVCVSLLLANYGDRKNKGIFKVSLKVEEKSYEIYKKAEEIRDNVFQHFCYEDIVISDLVHKQASIILEGVDSPRGEAITAWLTSGADASSHDHETKASENSLIFSLGARYQPAQQKIRTIVLVTICALSGLLLLWPDIDAHK